MKVKNNTLYKFIRQRSKELNISIFDYYEENKGKKPCVAPSTIYNTQNAKPSILTYTILSQMLDVSVDELRKYPIK